MAREDKKLTPPTQREREAETQINRVLRMTGGTAPERVELGRIADLDVQPERELLRQRQQAEAQQLAAQVDEGVRQAEESLLRAQEDARPGFQAQRDAIELDERQALDNQALYAELRGDRGGIGQAQSALIRNTAAINRAQVNREQQRLASDTARQIADLRVKGEFEKADGLLKLTQKHLSELMELERWAKNANLGVAEFNTQLARWEAEYAWQAQKYGVDTELSMARLTGAFGDGTPTLAARQAEESRLAELARLTGQMPDGTMTLAARQAERSALAEAARALMAAGLTLTADQAAALGWSEGQYEEYIRLRSAGETAAAAASSGSKGGSAKKLKLKEKAVNALKQTIGSEAVARADEMAAALLQGPGVPFQLLASWERALEKSENPEQTLAEIAASSYYPQISSEQWQRLAAVLRQSQS